MAIENAKNLWFSRKLNFDVVARAIVCRDRPRSFSDRKVTKQLHLIIMKYHALLIYLTKLDIIKLGSKYHTKDTVFTPLSTPKVEMGHLLRMNTYNLNAAKLVYFSWNKVALRLLKC